MSFKITILGTLAGLCATPSLGALLLPTSYEVQTPNNGVYAYQDDTYNGSNTAGYLSGGTGDLTDGLVASAHWNTTPGPWVGWMNSDPTIIFHFAAGTVLNTIDFYFDDARGAGAVSLPVGVSLSDGGAPLGVAPVITTDGVVGRYRYELNGLGIADLSATLLRSDQWVMLSEVTFNGSVASAAVPEPASWAMMLAGFGATGGALRSRRRIAANPG